MESITWPDEDGPVEWIQPNRVRTQTDQDRLDAATHYVQARLLLGRGESDRGLQSLARALRLDPSSDVVRLELVRVAYEVERSDMAARYALLYPERPIDAALWPQLAAHLTDELEFDAAIQLYEQVLQAMSRDKSDSEVRRVLINFQLGRLYYFAERPVDSARAYSVVLKSLEQDPQTSKLDQRLREILVGAPDAWALIGESFLEAEQWEVAERLFRREAERPQVFNPLPYYLARLAAARGESQKAWSLLWPVLEKLPADCPESAYLFLARLANSGDADTPQQAQWVGLLESAFAQDSQRSRVAAVLARHHAGSGNPDRAEELWREVRAWAPLVTLYYEREAWPELARVLIDVVSTYGNLEPIRAPLQPVSADTDATRQLLSHLAEPKEWKSSLAGAWLHLMSGTDARELATRFAHSYTQLPQGSDALGISWSTDLLLADQPQATLAILREVARRQVAPDRRPLLLYYRSLALESLGQFDASRIAAHQAVGLGPDLPELITHWGWCLQRDGYHQRARAVYMRFLGQFADDYSSPHVRDKVREARMVLANVELALKDVSAAEDQLECVLDEFPRHEGALNDLSYLWADQDKHLQRARSMAARAVADAPGNSAYRDTLGWVLYRIGDYAQSVRELRAATEMQEIPDAVILDHLGDALWHSGNRTEARQIWQRAADRIAETQGPEAANRIHEKLNRYSNEESD